MRFLWSIIKYMLGGREKEGVTSGILERKETTITSNNTTDEETLLDIGIAVDHEKHLYQIQLYVSDGQNMIIAVLPPQRLEMILREIQEYIANHYQPVGIGTMHPDVRLPCPAEKMLEEWR